MFPQKWPNNFDENVSSLHIYLRPCQYQQNSELYFFWAFQSTVSMGALWVNPRSSFVMGILVWWLWTPFFTSLISFYEVEPGSTQRWENQSLNVCPLGYLWPQSGMSTMLHLPSPSTAWINKATWWSKILNSILKYSFYFFAMCLFWNLFGSFWGKTLHKD